MKVVLDENLSPALAKALNALFAGEHDVRHLREMFGPSVSDEDWLAKLSGEGSWVVISGTAKLLSASPSSWFFAVQNSWVSSLRRR